MIVSVEECCAPCPAFAVIFCARGVAPTCLATPTAVTPTNRQIASVFSLSARPMCDTAQTDGLKSNTVCARIFPLLETIK